MSEAPSVDNPLFFGTPQNPSERNSVYHTARCRYFEQNSREERPATAEKIAYHDLTECDRCKEIRTGESIIAHTGEQSTLATTLSELDADEIGDSSK